MSTKQKLKMLVRRLTRMDKDRLTKDDFELDRDKFMAMVARHVTGVDAVDLENGYVSSRTRTILKQVEEFCETYYDRIDGGYITLMDRHFRFKLPTATLYARDGTEYTYGDMTAEVYFGHRGNFMHNLYGGKRDANGRYSIEHPHTGPSENLCSGYNPSIKWTSGDWDGVIDEAILYSNTYTVTGAYRVFPEDVLRCSYCGGNPRYEHEEEIGRCSSCDGTLCKACRRYCPGCDSVLCSNCMTDNLGYCSRECLGNSCPVCQSKVGEGDGVEVALSHTSKIDGDSVTLHEKCANDYAERCWKCDTPTFTRMSTKQAYLRRLSVSRRVAICRECAAEGDDTITNDERQSIKKCSHCSGYSLIYHHSRHFSDREFNGERMCIEHPGLAEFLGKWSMDGMSVQAPNPFPDPGLLAKYNVHSSLLIHDELSDEHGYTCSCCRKLEDAPDEMESGLLYLCSPSCMAFTLDNLVNAATRGSEEVAKILSRYAGESLPMKILYERHPQPSVVRSGSDLAYIRWRSQKWGTSFAYYEPVESEELQGVLL